MTDSEDHNAFAAEYVLGTLDASERAQVESMMATDKDFAGLVEAWERRLNTLSQMVGQVEPRSEVWEKIRAEIAQTTASSVQFPQAAAPSDMVAASPLVCRPRAPNVCAAAARPPFRN